MKNIIALFLMLVTASLTFSQDQKLLTIKNNENGKIRSFDEGQRIKVWTKDEVYKGRFTIKNDSMIVIGDETIALNDVYAFRGRTKAALATGISVIGAPTLFGGIATIYAFNGGDLGALILGAVGFTATVAMSPLGGYLIISNKKNCYKGKKFKLSID